MREIIKNTVYDTKTAERIVVYKYNNTVADSGLPISESLYVTKNTEHFLLQKYPGNKYIIPLMPSGAYAWLHDKGFVEEIKKYFPDKKLKYA